MNDNDNNNDNDSSNNNNNNNNDDDNNNNNAVLIMLCTCFFISFESFFLSFILSALVIQKTFIFNAILMHFVLKKHQNCVKMTVFVFPNVLFILTK